VESIKSDSARSDRLQTTKITALEEECSLLRSRASKLEVEVEARRIDLQGSIDKERSLAEKIDELRKDILKKEALREDVVSKFTQASRVISSQKEELVAQERRAVEAEQKAESLSKQIDQLQDTIKRLEASAETTGDQRLKQFSELQTTCTQLEKERSEARAEASLLRDELRQERRRSSDLDKRNCSLKSRVESTKKALDDAKAQLAEARSELEASEVTSKKLNGELEAERMEADHLKAKAQLLDATTARLKSDLLLMKEAALQSEFRVAASEGKDAKISQLKTEIKAKTAKLESLSEVYHSQQQVLAMSHTLEGRLLGFIEDAIGQVARAFNNVSSLVPTEHGGSHRLELPDNLRALALAGIEWPESNSIVEPSSLKRLSAVIPVVLKDLEDKRKHLSSLEKQRKARAPPRVSTPDAKTKKSIPDTPSIMDALQSIKRVLNEEVLSPVKNHEHGGGRLDSEYFHKVIFSLEGQIDGLLIDLKSANEALLAKDQLFADMEHLFTHHEMERDRLEQKLRSRSAELRDIEDRLKREVAWKRSAGDELSALRMQLKDAKEERRSVPVDASPSNANASKLAAGRLIEKFFEGQRKATLAGAFRHWSCRASAVRAAEQQKHIAVELAHQLDSTREKLGILKKHLKKSRRGDGSGLARILEGEGYETT